MIPWKFVILAFLLVYVHLAAAFNHKIDPARCKTDAKDATCFVRDSCIKKADNTSGEIGVLTQFNDQQLINDTCDVFMQIKPFTLRKWHVIMNITGDKLDTAKGISFTQGEVQFKCLDNNKVEEGLKTVVFGGGHKFSPTLMSCSIIISNEPDNIQDKFKRNSNQPTLIYYAGGPASEHKLKYEIIRIAFWQKPQASCDMDFAKSSASFTERWKLYEVDTTLSKFECNNEGGRLMLRFNGDKLVEEAFCKDSIYKYKPDDSDLKDVDDPTLDDPSSFYIHCAVEFCTMCAPLEPMECEGCVKPNAPEAAPGACKTVSCPSGKNWRLADGRLSKDALECKQDGEIASWFRNGTKIAEGACSDKADCKTFSGFDLSCPADTGDCTTVAFTEDSQTVYCPDGYNVTFGMEPIVVTGNLTCTADSGLYKSGDGPAPPQAAHVGCQKRSDPSVAAPSTGSSAGQTAGIVIGVLFFVVVIVILIFFLIKRRRRITADKTPQGPKPPEDDSDLKTAICTNSREGFMAAAASKSASGSEAPPSTDRPSKEKIGSEGPPSTERPSKEMMPDEKEKKDEKSGDKKDAKKGSKKEEEKEGGGSKREKKKEEKKEENKPKKKPAKITMDTTKKRLPTLQEANRFLEQMKKEPANFKPGKRVDATDITIAQYRLAAKPGRMIEHWNEEMFQEDLLLIVPNLKPEDRCYFLRNLTVFNQHNPKGNGENGSLTQFFQVVRRCQNKALDCPATWEIIIRLVKLMCANLPQKEAADIIDRMRKMMRDIGHMMLQGVGFVTNINRDTDDQQQRRELAIRILLAVDDPDALEELGKQAEAKPDDVDSHLQTAVFSHALNKMGKKKELEARLYEELKKSAKEHPKPKDKPFGTMRQHLIYALCSDKNEDGMRAALEMVLDPKSRRDQSTPEGEFNPTDVLCAFKGATEHPSHFPKVLAIFKAKQFAPSYADLADAVVDEYAKSPEEKREMKNQMKADIVQILLILGEICATNEQYLRLHHQIGPEMYYLDQPGSKDFDATKLDDRSKNLEAILKHKRCIEMIDKAMKKAEY